MNTKHTPGPWMVGDDARLPTGRTIRSTKRIYIADVECEANAAFIVRAVNAHADLVAACKGLIDDLADAINGDYSESDFAELVSDAKVALARAEGG